MDEILPALTKREFEILGLLAEGFSAKEIALKVAIGHRTVETHIDAMRLKLRARNRTHMVAMAIASRLLVFPVFSLDDFPALYSQGLQGLESEFAALDCA
ncbi:helix-turn-helix transcriptional regulator [Novosphingobium sp. G106]|uniref:helix-turn-helix domain-containing protein n=1 Tax=Novosphingobium sp. G106 TaxID=2849500 RepID=UPI001C2CC94D|nr:helix-turn-helix transcriptional regulator [Novosphingobium sp. G106]MBV1691428.1 helix-turn-helix transcriptional regulator [Novosphingobium sp. G106]